MPRRSSSEPSRRNRATNATGQDNLYAYTADLNPTNPASCFEIVGVSNQPPNRVICFRPRSSTGRLYRLMYVTNRASGAWTALPGATPGRAGPEGRRCAIQLPRRSGSTGPKCRCRDADGSVPASFTGNAQTRFAHMKHPTPGSARLR